MPTQICFNCKHSITSKKHKDKCITIYMNTHRTLSFDEVYNNPLMTFGLGGCTAFICITDNNVTMGHYSPLMRHKIISILKKKMNSAKYIYIKMPQNWVKNKIGQWEHNDLGIYDFLNNINCKIIKDVYDCSNHHRDDIFSYNSSIYLKVNNDNSKIINYTNSWGKWIIP